MTWTYATALACVLLSILINLSHVHASSNFMLAAKERYEWSCSDMGLVTCEPFLGDCVTPSGGCNMGTVTYPDVYCIDTSNDKVVSQSYCSSSLHPGALETPCVPAECVTLCAPSNAGPYVPCSSPASWACPNGAICGGSCPRATRVTACYDLSKDAPAARNICEGHTPATTATNAPYGDCGLNVTSFSTLVETPSPSTLMVTVSWSGGTADLLPAEPVLRLDFASPVHRFQHAGSLRNATETCTGEELEVVQVGTSALEIQTSFNDFTDCDIIVTLDIAAAVSTTIKSSLSVNGLLIEDARSSASASIGSLATFGATSMELQFAVTEVDSDEFKGSVIIGSSDFGSVASGRPRVFPDAIAIRMHSALSATSETVCHTIANKAWPLASSSFSLMPVTYAVDENNPNVIWVTRPVPASSSAVATGLRVLCTNVIASVPMGTQETLWADVDFTHKTLDGTLVTLTRPTSTGRASRVFDADTAVAIDDIVIVRGAKSSPQQPTISDLAPGLQRAEGLYTPQTRRLAVYPRDAVPGAVALISEQLWQVRAATLTAKFDANTLQRYRRGEYACQYDDEPGFFPCSLSCGGTPERVCIVDGVVSDTEDGCTYQDPFIDVPCQASLSDVSASYSKGTFSVVVGVTSPARSPLLQIDGLAAALNLTVLPTCPENDVGPEVSTFCAEADGGLVVAMSSTSLDGTIQTLSVKLPVISPTAALPLTVRFRRSQGETLASETVTVDIAARPASGSLQNSLSVQAVGVRTGEQPSESQSASSGSLGGGVLVVSMSASSNRLVDTSSSSMSRVSITLPEGVSVIPTPSVQGNAATVAVDVFVDPFLDYPLWPLQSLKLSLTATVGQSNNGRAVLSAPLTGVTAFSLQRHSLVVVVHGVTMPLAKDALPNVARSVYLLDDDDDEDEETPVTGGGSSAPDLVTVCFTPSSGDAVYVQTPFTSPKESAEPIATADAVVTVAFSGEFTAPLPASATALQLGLELGSTIVVDTSDPVIHIPIAASITWVFASVITPRTISRMAASAVVGDVVGPAASMSVRSAGVLRCGPPDAPTACEFGDDETCAAAPADSYACYERATLAPITASELCAFSPIPASTASCAPMFRSVAASVKGSAVTLTYATAPAEDFVAGSTYVVAIAFPEGAFARAYPACASGAGVAVTCHHVDGVVLARITPTARDGLLRVTVDAAVPVSGAVIGVAITNSETGESAYSGPATVTLGDKPSPGDDDDDEEDDEGVWFCFPPSGSLSTAVPCSSNGGFVCPTTGCGVTKVVRSMRCIANGFVVADSRCRNRRPAESTECELRTNACSVSFSGAVCTYTADGIKDPTLKNVTCLAGDGTTSVYSRGACTTPSGEVVESSWCKRKDLLRECPLPACSDGLSFVWESVPAGSCLNAASWCASYVPVTVTCLARAPGMADTVVAPELCDARSRPAGAWPCAEALPKCSNGGACRISRVPMEGPAAALMGACECPNGYTGSFCTTRVRLNSLAASLSEDGSFRLSWSVSPSSSSGFITIQASNDAIRAPLALGTAPLMSRSARVPAAPISRLFGPGPVKITVLAGSVAQAAVTVNAPRLCQLPGLTCRNSGVCTAAGDCSCVGGFGGSRCEISPCDAKGCNVAVSACNATGTGFADCQCPLGVNDEPLYADPLCFTPRGCESGAARCFNGGIPSGNITSDGVATCGDCICERSWTGPNCAECGRTCHNGGTASKDCESCSCPAGFAGASCSCRAVLATMIFRSTSLRWLLTVSPTSTAARTWANSVEAAVSEIIKNEKVTVEVSSWTAIDGADGHTYLQVKLRFRRASCEPLATVDTPRTLSISAFVLADGDDDSSDEDADKALLHGALSTLRSSFEGKTAFPSHPALTSVESSAGLGLEDPACSGTGCPANVGAGGTVEAAEPETDDKGSGNSGLSDGALIGIIVGSAVGGVLLLALLAYIFGCCCFAPKDMYYSETAV